MNLFGILFLTIIIECVFGSWLGRSFRHLNIPRDTTYFDAGAYYQTGQNIVYARDKFGLRGRYKDSATIDFLAIGGSTTDQRMITEGQTWQDVMAGAFSNSGKQVSVVNAGIDGQSTIGHLYNFEAWFPLIPQLKAKYVIAYIGINDVHTHMEHSADRLVADSLFLRIHHSIKNNSALYRLYRTISGVFHARRVRLTRPRKRSINRTWVSYSSQPINIEDRLPFYRARLKELVYRIKAFGADPLFVTQKRGDYRVDGDVITGISSPVGQPNGFDEGKALIAINHITMSVCDELKIRCFNLAKELVLPSVDFYDPVHLKPSGARKVGLYLYEKMKDLM